MMYVIKRQEGPFMTGACLSDQDSARRKATSKEFDATGITGMLKKFHFLKSRMPISASGEHLMDAALKFFDAACGSRCSV